MGSVSLLMICARRKRASNSITRGSRSDFDGDPQIEMQIGSAEDLMPAAGNDGSQLIPRGQDAWQNDVALTAGNRSVPVVASWGCLDGVFRL